MMSKFKFCPMCGNERIDNSQNCPYCNFKFLTGKYVKVKEEKHKEIQFEKVSQEEFVEANQFIIDTNLNINTLFAKYLNYSLSNQFNENYGDNIPIVIREYISTYQNSEVSNEFNENFLDFIKDILNSEDYRKSISIFLQWIDENRSHLPGFVLNQYMIPHQNNINNIEEILSLDLEDNDENKLFFDYLKKFFLSEKEFLDRLI